jgi:hypothetical protein
MVQSARIFNERKSRKVDNQGKSDLIADSPIPGTSGSPVFIGDNPTILFIKKIDQWPLSMGNRIPFHLRDREYRTVRFPNWLRKGNSQSALAGALAFRLTI